MSARFSGKVALVAGGTGGLGRAVSLAFLAEEAIQVNRPVDWSDSIFRKQNDLDGLRSEKVNKVANDCVDRAQIWNNHGAWLVAADVRRRIFINHRFAGAFPPPHVGGYGTGSEPLQVVVQVGQINQAQRRVILVLDPLG